MAPNKMKFQEGEKVLCFHGPLIYEAKCLKAQLKDKQPKYFIHYAGWNKNWDEWVPESRVLKLSDQNLNKQKDILKNHETLAKSKKKAAASAPKPPELPGPPKKPGRPTKELSNTPGGATSGGGDDSRSSTPSTDRSTSSKRSTTTTSTTPGGGGPLPPKGTDSEESRKKKARLENTVETEEQFTSTVEVKTKLPDELKPVLVDDWDLINRQHKLVLMPAKVSVDTILADFIKARSNLKNNTPNRESAVQEVVSGLREYFNVMIGTQLLYKFERPQYADILKENPEQKMSSIYGFVHITRLFVRLGQMLAYTQLDEKSMNLLSFHLQDFLRYMVKNMDTYYSIHDYGIAPPEYHRKAL